MGKAIASYERTLMTPDSPFDLFQKGNENAMNRKAKEGWKTFYKKGCAGCHSSPTFTGKEIYIKFPRRTVLTKDYDYVFNFTEDKGLYLHTKERKDINRWRVPSLRNIEITYPYFHNGTISGLKEAVKIMGKTQLGIILENSEVEKIVEFLKSLTGKIPKETRPVLPD